MKKLTLGLYSKEKEGKSLDEWTIEANKKYLIGRNPDKTSITISDGTISRIHAELEHHSDGKVTIKDLSSANGTFINGEQILTQIKTDLPLDSKLSLGESAKYLQLKESAIDHIESNKRRKVSVSKSRSSRSSSSSSSGRHRVKSRDRSRRGVKKREEKDRNHKLPPHRAKSRRSKSAKKSRSRNRDNSVARKKKLDEENRLRIEAGRLQRQRDREIEQEKQKEKEQERERLLHHKRLYEEFVRAKEENEKEEIKSKLPKLIENVNYNTRTNDPNNNIESKSTNLEERYPIDRAPNEKGDLYLSKHSSHKEQNRRYNNYSSYKSRRNDKDDYDKSSWRK